MSLDNVLPVLVFIGFIILFVALIVGGSVMGARRFAEVSARLEQQSMERGWRYQGFRDGSTTVHSFSGETGGVSWQIESYYRQSSNSSGSSGSMRYTRWWTEAAALSGEVVLLLPNSVGSAFQALGSRDALKTLPGGLGGLANSLIEMAVRHLVTDVLHAAPEDARAFDTVRQVQAGSEALRQHYAVLATGEMTANRFLDEDAERMLLELAPAPGVSTQKLRTMAVVYWHKGIQLIVERQIVEIDKLEQIVRLGLALVSGQKQSVWS